MGNGVSQGRRKAARLFLISPTEDMYVRELCRQIWFTVVLFERQKRRLNMILWVEFVGCVAAMMRANYRSIGMENLKIALLSMIFANQS